MLNLTTACRIEVPQNQFYDTQQMYVSKHLQFKLFVPHWILRFVHGWCPNSGVFHFNKTEGV